MAVTLEITDFLLPLGDLYPELFPGFNLPDLLDGWINQAIGQVESNSGIEAADHNDAASAWVRYRAYSLKAQTVAAAPSSASVGPTSKSYAQDQRTYWRQKAIDALSEFVGFDTANPVQRTPATSLSLNNTAVW